MLDRFRWRAKWYISINDVMKWEWQKIMWPQHRVQRSFWLRLVKGEPERSTVGFIFCAVPSDSDLTMSRYWWLIWRVAMIHKETCFSPAVLFQVLDAPIIINQYRCQNSFQYTELYICNIDKKQKVFHLALRRLRELEHWHQQISIQEMSWCQMLPALWYW